MLRPCIFHVASVESWSSGSRDSSKTPGRSMDPLLMAICARPPSWVMSKSTVAPLSPGRPGDVRVVVAAAGCPSAIEGLAARLSAVARPLTANVSGASMEPCQRALRVSTRPLGAKDLTSAWVGLPSGRRLAICARAARSSLSARSSVCSGRWPSGSVWLSVRLPPGHCSPSRVRKRRFSVLKLKPSARRAPPTRPDTDSKASASSWLPSRASTPCSATSASPPASLPSLTSAQARNAPLPVASLTPRLSRLAYCVMRERSARANSP